ncbi:RNA-directed DNA polymerase, eukaryota, reverse transcriptase zinc-binding domain protein [Tanacetum coccineum]
MNKAGTKLSKLDRFLILEEVFEALPNVLVTAIDRLWSDHNPILLHVSKSDFGPTPFKLFHSWLLRDSFDKVIKMELPKLEEHNFERKLLFHENFHLLKARIKQWHSETKTSSHVTKHDNLQLIKSIEEKIEAGSANDDDRDSRIKLLQEVDILDTFESFDLFQKARVKWDIEGDKNSKFFHGRIKQKRRAQMIHGIMKEGDCGSSKAPSPDGFSFAFVKKYWDDIKVDILEYVNIFLDTDGLQNALSTAVSSGLIRGIKFSSPELTISHLFYVDEVIITTECNANDLDNIIHVLQWRWRLLSHKNALWVKVIKALHGQEGGFYNNGCIYTGDSPFYIRYNMLYRLEREKDCLIIDRIDYDQWRRNWSRPNLGVQNFVDLLDMLFEISSAEINEVEDTCVWSLGTDGTFYVKDARCIIDSKILPSLAPTTVWDKNIPRKVNIFIWRVILDRLSHKLSHSSRGINIHAIYCPSCNGNMESSNHIFFECNIAKDIWILVRKWCDSSFSLFTLYEDWKGLFSSWQMVKEKSRRLSVIFSSLWWLWRYRNSVTFRSNSMRKSDIFDNIRLSSYSWLHHRGHMICNWIDWLKSHMLLSSNGLG